MGSGWAWRALLWLLLSLGAFRLVDGLWTRQFGCSKGDRCPFLILSSPASRDTPEGSAVRGLQEIFAAQMKHREKHQGYWREDVAGLYLGSGPSEGWPKLISQAVALADVRPSGDLFRAGTPEAYSGYRYFALRHFDEVNPSPDRWAAAAEPGLGVGCCVLVIDERGEIWHAPFLRGLEQFPSAGALDVFWRRVGEGWPSGLVHGAILMMSALLGMILTAYVLAPEGTAAELCFGLIAVALVPWAAWIVHPRLSWRSFRWGLDSWAPKESDLFTRIGLGVALAPVVGALSLAICLLAACAGPWAEGLFEIMKSLMR